MKWVDHIYGSLLHGHVATTISTSKKCSLKVSGLQSTLTNLFGSISLRKIYLRCRLNTGNKTKTTKRNHLIIEEVLGQDSPGDDAFAAVAVAKSAARILPPGPDPPTLLKTDIFFQNRNAFPKEQYSVLCSGH